MDTFKSRLDLPGREVDNLTFLHSMNSINKSKEYESTKNIKYDISEQKIILTMLANNEHMHRLSSIKSETNMIDFRTIKNKTKKKKKILFGNKKEKSQKNGRVSKKKATNKNRAIFKRDSTINSKIIPFLILIKDTRTAFMLFVVSIVFITCYLPSILATRSLLSNDNLYIVYLYFTNSAINPIIYSFMNRSFRADLIKLFKNKSKPIFSASKFSSFTVFSISPNLAEVKNV